MTAMTGEDLVRLVRAEGPENTVFHLYNLYDSILYKNSVKHLTPPCLNPLEHSLDVKQDTWLSVFLDLKNFFEGKKEKYYQPTLGWLLTINRNKCFGHLKTYQKDNQFFPLEETEHCQSSTIKISSPLDSLIEEEKRQWLLNIITSMPAREQIILRLFWEGVSHNFIAKMLNITPVNSRQILSRALGKLQEQVARGKNQ